MMHEKTGIFGLALLAVSFSGSIALACASVPNQVTNANGWKWTSNAKSGDKSGCLRGVLMDKFCDSGNQCTPPERECMKVTKGSKDPACQATRPIGYRSYCGIGTSPWADHYWTGTAPICGNQDCRRGYVKIARDKYGDAHIECGSGKRNLCVKYKNE